MVRFPEVKVRPLEAQDLPAVSQVLGEWLIDPETGFVLTSEVAHRVDQIQQALTTGMDPRYFVAEDPEGSILGVMGLQADAIDAELYSLSETPVEVITAYVRRASRGHGVGQALTDALERVASERGFSTLLIVSGSRDRESGYPFWRARYGDPMRVDENYFGPGAERVVWRSWLRP